MPEATSRAFEALSADGVRLCGEDSGHGTPIVLLHGLTATRRYVVMGSRALERSGHRTIAYDARGHGRSAPAPDPTGYTYEMLADDLRTVLDHLEVERAMLAGASMGAQTALRFALDHPARVCALCLITPAFDPDATADYQGWNRLAKGLRDGGVEGFVAAYDLDPIPAAWRETVVKVLRQRLSRHEHPRAVADALERVPRSRPFERWQDLATVAVPTTVLASRDEADPSHPLAVAERYAGAIGGASLVVEEPGSSPIAWSGGRVSLALGELSSQSATGLDTRT